MTLGSEPYGRPVRVLVVDDERQNRELLAVMLEPEGFVVLTAVSGDAALALVAREPPDIILLDVMMPGLDGYQVTSALKGTAATWHIPVILLSGLDDHQAMMLGRKAGANDFLCRPVDRADLCARVRTLVDTGISGISA